MMKPIEMIWAMFKVYLSRIIYLEQGKIIEEGSHDELIKLGGKYAYMYQIQSQYYMEKQGNEK